MAHLDNEYPVCDDCRLCKVVNEPENTREIQNTLLDQTDHFQWIPGLGSFVEGYSLIVSKNHVLNTGCFDINIINELEFFINEIKEVLYRIYNQKSIVFEHGSMGNRDYAGSCIEHHHLHIMPSDISHIPKVLLDNFVNHGPFDSMNCLRQFNRNHLPYIYFAPISGEHNVFEVQILPKQYLRQVIAAECGHPQDWDWRDKPYIENIETFVTKITDLTMER
jgi:diadenosine tetraphosphate (Ap4A) HIT family hydrolase